MQHGSVGGLLCTPAAGDCDRLTEDDAIHTSGTLGSMTLSRTNGFIAGA